MESSGDFNKIAQPPSHIDHTEIDSMEEEASVADITKGVQNASLSIFDSYQTTPSAESLDSRDVSEVTSEEELRMIGELLQMQELDMAAIEKISLASTGIMGSVKTLEHSDLLLGELSDAVPVASEAKSMLTLTVKIKKIVKGAKACTAYNKEEQSIKEKLQSTQDPFVQKMYQTRLKILEGLKNEEKKQIAANASQCVAAITAGGGGAVKILGMLGAVSTTAAAGTVATIGGLLGAVVAGGVVTRDIAKNPQKWVDRKQGINVYLSQKSTKIKNTWNKFFGSRAENNIEKNVQNLQQLFSELDTILTKENKQLQKAVDSIQEEALANSELEDTIDEKLETLQEYIDGSVSIPLSEDLYEENLLETLNSIRSTVSKSLEITLMKQPGRANKANTGKLTSSLNTLNSTRGVVKESCPKMKSIFKKIENINKKMVEKSDTTLDRQKSIENNLTNLSAKQEKRVETLEKANIERTINRFSGQDISEIIQDVDEKITKFNAGESSSEFAMFLQEALGEENIAELTLDATHRDKIISYCGRVHH